MAPLGRQKANFVGVLFFLVQMSGGLEAFEENLRKEEEEKEAQKRKEEERRQEISTKTRNNLSRLLDRKRAEMNAQAEEKSKKKKVRTHTVNRGAPFRWAFGPHSACGSIESTTILTTHPSLFIFFFIYLSKLITKSKRRRPLKRNFSFYSSARTVGRTKKITRYLKSGYSI